MPVWTRAISYMLLVGGGWLLALPMVLMGFPGYREIHLHPKPWPELGLLLLAAGVVLAAASGYYLISVGRGTPFPLDPTSRLVTRGPYRYIRNPQAAAMMLMSTAEVISIQSRTLWLLIPFALLYLEVLAGPWEERQLLSQYGEQYLAYIRRVRKWIPIPLRPTAVNLDQDSRSTRSVESQA